MPNPLVAAPYETCWRSECWPGCYYTEAPCQYRPTDDAPVPTDDWHGSEARQEAKPFGEGCTCPTAIRPLGILYGVNMGKGPVRLSTTKGCPIHDACRGWTARSRAKRINGRLLYCPKHGTKDCPDPRESKG